MTEARQKYDAALAEKVLAQEERPELIILAGWMHVFSAPFLEPLEKAGIKVINLHPALPGMSDCHVTHCTSHTQQVLISYPGEFDGAGAIERAYAEFKAGRLTRTGIMVHYVVLKVDRGDPILTQEIPWEGEDLQGLEKKIHSHEHVLLVKAAAKVVGEILKSR